MSKSSFLYSATVAVSDGVNISVDGGCFLDRVTVTCTAKAGNSGSAKK